MSGMAEITGSFGGADQLHSTMVKKARFSAPARRKNGASGGKSETSKEGRPDST